MISFIATSFFDSALDWLNSKILGLAAFIIGFINEHVLTFFDEKTIKQLLDFSSWINMFIFGISFLVVLVDIAEEKISGKPVYPAVVFTNTIKALSFAVFARWIAVWGMEISNTITSYFGISLSADSFSLHLTKSIDAFLPGGIPDTIVIHLVIMLLIIIAVVVFLVMALKRFGTMFIHIFTSVLYIPDIMRGDTTKMGEWLRQMTAIVLTYTFIYLMFFLGCGFFNSDNLLMCFACWITMPVISRILNKYGWSSGSQGNFGAMAIQTGVMMIR